MFRCSVGLGIKLWYIKLFICFNAFKLSVALGAFTGEVWEGHMVRRLFMFFSELWWHYTGRFFNNCSEEFWMEFAPATVSWESVSWQYRVLWVIVGLLLTLCFGGVQTGSLILLAQDLDGGLRFLLFRAGFAQYFRYELNICSCDMVLGNYHLDSTVFKISQYVLWDLGELLLVSLCCSLAVLSLELSNTMAKPPLRCTSVKYGKLRHYFIHLTFIITYRQR